MGGFIEQFGKAEGPDSRTMRKNTRFLGGLESLESGFLPHVVQSEFPAMRTVRRAAPAALTNRPNVGNLN